MQPWQLQVAVVVPLVLLEHVAQQVQELVEGILALPGLVRVEAGGQSLVQVLVVAME